MHKMILAGLAVAGIAVGAASPASACHDCAVRAAGHRHHAREPHFRYGFHEFHGFYDSCYRPSPGGGFYNAVGRDCLPRRTKRHGRAK